MSDSRSAQPGQPPLFQPSVQSVPTGKEGDESLEMVELRSGWMVKQGNIRKSWRRRFFVLQGGTLFGRLDYYKHERKGWKGAVSLRYAERAETIMTPPKVKNLYCFSIRTPTRVWLIGAESEDDRSTWIAAINAVLSHIRDPQASMLVIQPKAPAIEKQDGEQASSSSSESTPQDSAPSSATAASATSEQLAPSTPPAAAAAAPTTTTAATTTIETAPQQTAPQAKEAEEAPAEEAPQHHDSAPEYTQTDPMGDRRRHEDLKQCERFVPMVEQERALRREARDTVPLGRLISVSFPPTPANEQPGEGAEAATETESDAARAELPSTIQLSRLLVEWGTALADFAGQLVAHRTEALDSKGLPVTVFEDAGGSGGKPCERDVRFVLLAYSEAFDKLVSGIDRRHLSPADLSSCRALLEAWAELLRSLASTEAAEALAVGQHPRLGAESPVQVLPPEAVKKISAWAVPALTPAAQPRVPLLERRVLAAMAAEKSFMAWHLERLLACGPVRFGFLTVRVPAQENDDFSRLAGRCPDGPYENELVEGRLFCELTHESLCFTRPGEEYEVVVPLLWIRKLEVETTSGCYMKFTRYLAQPSADTQLESRVLYADNSPETYNWLSDITRAFAARRKAEQHKQQQQQQQQQ